MAYITDDVAQDPNGTCADCATHRHCKSIRWTERPCEVKAQIADQHAAQARAADHAARAAAAPASDDVAPWQRPRVDTAAPGVHPTPTPAAPTVPPTPNIPEGWWRCNCGALNLGARLRCWLCERERDVPKEVADGLGAIVEQTKAEFLQTFASGAKSSEHKLRYDLIPWHIFSDRLAKRYTDGAVKYGEFNWQKGLTERAYVLDRANHALTHLHRAVEQMRSWTFGSSRPISEMPISDDDLAAAMWGIIFLMAAQRGSADLECGSGSICRLRGDGSWTCPRVCGRGTWCAPCAVRRGLVPITRWRPRPRSRSTCTRLPGKRTKTCPCGEFSDR